MPSATKIEDLMKNKDLYVEGGFWVLVEVDFSFLSKKIVRINITMPQFKLAVIGKEAKKRRITRSAFLVKAAEAVCEEGANHTLI